MKFVLAALLFAVALPGAGTTPVVANYAIFSPAILAGLPAERDTPVAHKVLTAAKRALSGSPDPMSHVHTEGTLPHHGIRDRSAAAERDWGTMLVLGLAYRMTGDARFLAAEQRYLGAWVSVYRPDFNPIDETNLDQVMMAYDLTRSGLSAQTQAQADALWRQMAEGYIDWVEKNGHKDNANWTSHRVKLAVLAAYETGDPSLERRAAAIFRSHLARNVRSDGSVQDFYKRDALHYVVYDLDPMEMAALAAKVHGESWFHEGSGGKNLAHAVDWLIPYAEGRKTHQEFVHSSVRFDAERDQAGEKGYSGLWNPAAGVETLTLASLLDAHYMQPLAECVAHTGRKPPTWMLLFNAAGSGSALPGS